MINFKKDSKWKNAFHYGDLKSYKDKIYYNVDKYRDKRYWKDGKLHRDDGPAVECTTGYKAWYKKDKLHRLNGPAVEYASGSKEWYIEGKYYTEKQYKEKIKKMKEEYKEKIKMMEIDKDPKWKSALKLGKLKHYKDDIYFNIDFCKTKRYWKDGKIHRDDGPALECADGYKEWYIEGKLHKNDGPAIEYPDGDKEWYKEGKCHREDGPALESEDGYKEWWIEGENYTEKEYKEKIKKMKFDKLPKWKEEEYKEKIKKIKFNKDPKWKNALKYGNLKHYKNNTYYNENKSKSKRYWKDGLLHRSNGPAIEYANGNKEWYKDGKLHRLDGPAIERMNGSKSWAIEGKKYTEEEYKHKIKMMEIKKDPRWNFASSFGELKHYKDEVYYNVDKNEEKRYWKDGKNHRDDGPAIECTNGYKAWFKEDKLHRLDGPAIEYADKNKSWFIEGVKYAEKQFNRKIKNMEFEKDSKWKDAFRFGELEHYKDDIYYNVDRVGNKRYWKDGLLNRDDGPSYESKEGTKSWYKNNHLHRLDGPAIEWANGNKEWYIKGVRYTEEAFNDKVKIMEFEKDPKWERALSCGELKHYKDDIYYNIDERGDKRYWKDGIYHRDDGPAIEFQNGSNGWYIEGSYYAEEEYKKIKKIKFDKKNQSGKMLQFAKLKHYKDDIYYNVDEHGTKRYWKDGKYHRLDGPAVEYAHGSKYWYIEGKYYTEEEFNKKIHKIDQLSKTEEEQTKNTSLIDINEFKRSSFETKLLQFSYKYKEPTKLLDGLYSSQNIQKNYFNGILHSLIAPSLISENVSKYFIYGISTENFECPYFKVLIDKNKIKSISSSIEGCLTSYDDNPAIVGLIDDEEYSFWFKDGILHRDEGPAIKSNSVEVYCNNGEITNEKGPAFISNEKIEYRKDGKLHRTDGPSLEIKGVKKEWRIDGVLHRDDGPAIEYEDGKKEWYKNGKKVSENNIGNTDGKQSPSFPIGVILTTALGGALLNKLNEIEALVPEKILVNEIKNIGAAGN